MSVGQELPMDGTVFIARNAAKQRAGQSPAGKVVMHPVAIRYFFLGPIGPAIGPVLEEIPAGQGETFYPLFDAFLGSFELLASVQPTPSGP